MKNGNPIYKLLFKYHAYLFYDNGSFDCVPGNKPYR